jgi:hypothetical protein
MFQEQHRTIAEQALEVAAHLPPGSFTLDDFVDHATGLNAIRTSAEVGPMLKHLVDNEIIRPLNTPLGQPTRWICCTVHCHITARP